MFRLTSKLHNTSSWYTEDFDIPAYLRALSVEPAPASYELLAQLHRAHVETFPFTNVDVVREMHPGINPSTAQDQLMNKNRGGYCFEHAQIFAAAAEYLGFEVRRHLGRVKSLNLSRTHMSVVVTVDGTDYLCDPGFGFSIYEPVELRDGATGVSVGQTFTLEQGVDGSTETWSLTRKGEVEHIVDMAPFRPEDARTGHFLLSADPASVFKNHLMSMRHFGDHHLTVTERPVTVRREGQQTEQREVSALQAARKIQQLGLNVSDDEVRRIADLFRDKD